jgi:hypothetical protein
MQLIVGKMQGISVMGGELRVDGSVVKVVRRRLLCGANDMS